MLHPEARSAVVRLTGGQYFLETDAGGVYLVSAAGGERAPIVQFAQKNEDFPLVKTLSDRELQAFAMLGDGHEMGEIAREMGVSIKTVETYRARIKQKFGIKHRMQLLALAVEWRLRSSDGQADGQADDKAPTSPLQP
jgi:DNA-binding CsgD family transcriptional regulator